MDLLKHQSVSLYISLQYGERLAENRQATVEASVYFAYQIKNLIWVKKWNNINILYICQADVSTLLSGDLGFVSSMSLRMMQAGFSLG